LSLSAVLDSARLRLQQYSHRLHILPIVILYLNDICDSRCGTCSIWMNNDLLKAAAERQMTDSLLDELYGEVPKWRPRQVLLSGGEPLLHPRFGKVVRMFKSIPSTVCVVTNGLLLSSCDSEALRQVAEFYISFDAPDRKSYEEIRGVDGFERLASGLKVLNSIVPRPAIVARCTLQRANVTRLPELVRSARELGFDKISFLGVDVGSEAFARDRHGPSTFETIQPTREDLSMMEAGIESLDDVSKGFIEGGSEKLRRILRYFRSLLGDAALPEVRCNAPWVSVVVETTGKIRGCFFQPVIGDFRSVNGETAVRFRHSLDVRSNSTCQRCVCSKLLGVQDFLRM